MLSLNNSKILIYPLEDKARYFKCLCERKKFAFFIENRSVTFSLQPKANLILSKWERVLIVWIKLLTP